MTRIVFRIGSTIPSYEYLEVGEPVFDPDRFRIGVGVGNDQPLWMPRIDPANQDQIFIGASLMRSEVGGERARAGFNAPDQFVIVTKSGTRITVSDAATTFGSRANLTAGGSLSGDFETSGGRFTSINIRQLVVNSDTDRVSIRSGDTGAEVGAIDNRGVTSIAQRELMLTLGAYMESQNSINRNTYSSGLLSTRSGAAQVPFKVKGKRHRGGLSALNAHSHPDYRGIVGSAEMSFLVHGYHIQTRHNDYRLMRPVKGTAFGTRALNNGVPVPAAVTRLPTGYTGLNLNADQTGTQTAWMRNVYRNNPEQCVFELAYLEVWLQRYDGAVIDIATSTRNANEAREFKRVLEQAHYYLRSGLKIPSENLPLPNGVVTTFDAAGHPVLAYVNWRISSVPVATLSSREVDLAMDGFTYRLKALPFERSKAIQGVVDGTNRFRLRRNLQDTMLRRPRAGEVIYDAGVSSFLGSAETRLSWSDLLDSTAATFDVENLADLCRQCPGFNGLGDYTGQNFKDPYDAQRTFGATRSPAFYAPSTQEGFYYYDNRYKMNGIDAMGATASTRGWNDNNLFSARTDHPQVVGGWTYMLPLELVLRTPRENWNPFGVAKKDQPVGNGTADAPYDGFGDAGTFFTVPADALVPSAASLATVADTRTTAFVQTGAGIKACHANGVRLFDVTGERTRFPVVPEALAFDRTGVELEFFKDIMKGLLRKAAAGQLTGDEIEAAF